MNAVSASGVLVLVLFFLIHYWGFRKKNSMLVDALANDWTKDAELL